MAEQVQIAVIGGSGLYNMPELSQVEKHQIPTPFGDPSGEIVIGTLQRLNKKHGATIVLITHDLATAQHAERIVRIKDGLIVEDSKSHTQILVNDLHLV